MFNFVRTFYRRLASRNHKLIYVRYHFPKPLFSYRFDIMNLKPIRTESDYQQALKEIEQIFDAEPNTPEYEKLDILTTLVEVYEQQNYPIDPPSPIAAILYYLESRNQGVSTFIGNLKYHGVSEEIINIALNEMTH